MNIPNSVTNIADFTFFHCTSLGAVSIGNQVRSIGSLAFSGCTHLSSVVLPDSVTNIKDGIADKGLGGAFSYCFSLTNAALGNGVTNIGDLTFLDCGELVNLTIPDSVVTMGGALFNCTGLTNVNIGSGLASPLSVVGCTSLAAIKVSPANAMYSSRDGVLFNKAQTMLLVYPAAKGGNYTVTAKVTNIDLNAFVFCTSLVGVYFQGNAPSVGSGSFTGDTNTIYYLPGTTGWASTFGGRPALLWNPHAVVNDGNFGVRQNGFGFNIEGTPDIPLVVEAHTNLTAQAWVALQSCTLTNGLVYFTISSGRIIQGVSTAFGRLEWAWRKETMHRMNRSNITCKLGRTRMRLIGDFFRSGKAKKVHITTAMFGAAWLGLLTPIGGVFCQDFTLTSAPATNWSCVASSADGKRLVAAVNGGFIYISTNSGLNWTQTTGPTNSWGGLATSADGSQLFAGVSQSSTGIYRSTNSGATWEPTDSGPAGYQTSLACSADGRIVALARDYVVRISTDFGLTWTNFSPRGVPASFNIARVACSADGTTLVVVVSWDYLAPSYIQTTPISWWAGAEVFSFDYQLCGSIAISTDGSRIVASANNAQDFLPPTNCGGTLCSALNFGTTVFTNCSTVSNWTSVACSADGSHLIAAATSGEIYHSADAGLTWESLNAPKRAWSGIAASADGTRLVAAANGGGIYIWQRPVTPVLDVIPQGDVLRLSWIIPSADCTLQENCSLATTNWDRVAPKPTLNLTNLQNQVSLPIDATNRFYRLKSGNGGT